MNRRRLLAGPKRVALFPEMAAGDVVGPGDDIGAWLDRALSASRSAAARCQVRAYRVDIRAYPQTRAVYATIMKAAA